MNGGFFFEGRLDYQIIFISLLKWYDRRELNALSTC